MIKSIRKMELYVKSAMFLSLCIIVHLLVTSYVIKYESDKTTYYKIQDFHYYIVMIKSFWFKEIVSIYDPKYQLMAIDKYFGTEMNFAYPLGISPTALLIMLPLSLVARYSFPLANTLWVSVFLSIYAVAVLKIYFRLRAYERNVLPLFIMVFSVFFFSFRTVTVIFLGQTSLLASGLLLFLLLELLSARDGQHPPRRFIIYPIMFVLSMKIHYLILGMGILLLGGYLYELLASCVIVGLSIAFLIAYTGPALWMGFMEQISLFSAHELPAYYEISNVFHTFITFRSAFAPIIGGPLSLKISLIVLSVGCISIFCLYVFKSAGMGKDRNNLEKFAPLPMIVALFALLLLFFPYIGGYEDLLMCVPFAAVCLIPGHAPRKYGRIVVVVPFLFIVLNQSVMSSAMHLWMFLGMKTSIFVGLFLFSEGAMRTVPADQQDFGDG